MPEQHRGSCPVCDSKTIDRIGGEWCPRCRGWVQWVTHSPAFSRWTVVRPLT